MSTTKECQGCAQTIERAGQTLSTLLRSSPERLPPRVNWKLISLQLIDLAGLLRDESAPSS